MKHFYLTFTERDIAVEAEQNGIGPVALLGALIDIMENALEGDLAKVWSSINERAASAAEPDSEAPRVSLIPAMKAASAALDLVKHKYAPMVAEANERKDEFDDLMGTLLENVLKLHLLRYELVHAGCAYRELQDALEGNAATE